MLTIRTVQYQQSILTLLTKLYTVSYELLKIKDDLQYSKLKANLKITNECFPIYLSFLESLLIKQVSQACERKQTKI